MRTHALRLRHGYLMRRFLFLALSFGLLLPTAANAARHWLVMSVYGLEKIEMRSKEHCMSELDRLKGNINVYCVEGK